MTQLKKRRKMSRMRGTRLHGHAAKKHKGSGNRGGKGMAGTGKRAGQRKNYILKHYHPYFGKQGYTSRAEGKKGYDVMNLGEIQQKLDLMIKKGIAKKEGSGFSVDLSRHKILGEGELKLKLMITAAAFSGSAKEKVEAAGGSISLAKKAKAE